MQFINNRKFIEIIIFFFFFFNGIKHFFLNFAQNLTMFLNT